MDARTSRRRSPDGRPPPGPAPSSGRPRAAGRRCTRRTGRGSRSGARPPGTRLSAIAKRSATSGWPRWNAVSKQATWGISGWRARICADRRQIVRLVQRRQRHQLLEPVQHRVVDQDRRGEVRPAMDDPVADRARRAAELAEQPRLEPVRAPRPASATSSGGYASSTSIVTGGVLGRRDAAWCRCPRSDP